MFLSIHSWEMELFKCQKPWEIPTRFNKVPNKGPLKVECYLNFKGVLWLCEKQGEEISVLTGNLRTERGWPRDRERCKIMEKAAFGAPCSPTVSRIEVRHLGGWMNWAEVSRNPGGSNSGKVIFLGWNDLNWCSRELREEIGPTHSWMWAVTLKRQLLPWHQYRGTALREGTFLSCWDAELLGDLGLGLWALEAEG